MATLTKSNLLFVFIISFIHFVTVAYSSLHHDNVTDCIEERGFYNKSTNFQANLNYILSNLSSIAADTKNSEFGFYNLSYGTNSDTAYAIALCRGDVDRKTCLDCISRGSEALPAQCPAFFEAITAYDECMVRYANRPIFGTMEILPYFFWYGLSNISNSALKGFDEARTSLLDSLSVGAASGGSRLKYASGKTAAPNNQTIYAAVQCTPDLSMKECRACMNAASGLIPKCCGNRLGGRVIQPSCNLRWEVDQFYSTPATSPVMSPASPPAAPAVEVPANSATPAVSPGVQSGAESMFEARLVLSGFLILWAALAI